MNATKHLTAAAPDVGSAYEACRHLAAGSYENFNVGSRFIKRRLRPHFYSVYAFCRLVDDLGDEVEGNRLELLDRWEDELHLCYSGSPKLIWFQALQRTIDEFDIPPEPFLRLIEANRRDQRDKEYADSTRWSNTARTQQLRSVTWFFTFTDTFRMRCQATRTTRASLCNWLTSGKMSLVIMGRDGSTFPCPTWMNSALSYQLSENANPHPNFGG